MDDSKKRKTDDSSGREPMDNKKKKQWQMPKKNFFSAPQIEPGDAGIWVTCDMHMEGLCTVELKDFFNECAKSFYGDSSMNETLTESDGKNASEDIEAEINQEIKGMQDSREKALFVPVKLEIPCVLFFKTREPVEPVSFVQRVCEEAMNKEARKTTRFVRRLTPATRMGKASYKNLEEIATAILAPVFHTGDAMAQKFAIRTTIRNNHAMQRDDIIKRVADLVGGPHTVDLKNYDRLILVDVYRNVLGMSVIGPSYEKLKRFNLAEIYHASGEWSEH
ncbi:MAG: hypothetical protein LQ352_007063 [Teloschistes flavicans]|nr:MAG: hypothetical protein LQ352_007063 [Teloschistes flavicans]